MLWKSTHFRLSEGWKFIGLAISSDLLAILHAVFQMLQPDHCMQKATYVLDGDVLYSTMTLLGPFSIAGGFGAKFILASLFETSMCSRSMAIKRNHCMWWSKPKPIPCQSLDGWLDTEHMETRRWHPCCKWKHGFWTHSPMKRSSHIDMPTAPGECIVCYYKSYGAILYSSLLKLVCLKYWKIFIFCSPAEHSWKTWLLLCIPPKWERQCHFSMKEWSSAGKPSEELMFKQEVQRVNAGVPHQVPGQTESYNYRVIWTRLNVKPAKIMQVSYV